MKLEIKDIQFVASSVMDDVGRVFIYNDSIYRAILPESIEKVRNLFECGLIDDLNQQNLIPHTEITKLQLEGFGMIIKHQRLPLSNPYEWTFDMLRDAAIVTLKVNTIANKYNFRLKDGHNKNILFNNTLPMFIDIGSLARFSEPSFFDYEFLLSYCLPLILFSRGESYLVHKFLLDSYFPYSRLNQRNIPNAYVRIVSSYYKVDIWVLTFCFTLPVNKFTYNIFNFLSTSINYRFKLENLSVQFRSNPKAEYMLYLLKYRPDSFWFNYHEKIFNFNKLQSSNRFDFIISECQKLNGINSIVDIAANQGAFTLLLHRKLNFLQIFHFDYDIHACNYAYLYYKENNIPASVICSSFLELSKEPSFCQRIEADAVFGLAITHHLILGQGLQIDIILKTFDKITRRYIFIEFMPLGLWDGKSEKLPSVPYWYNVNWFRENFTVFFDLILERQTERNRIIFIGSKKAT